MDAYVQGILVGALISISIAIYKVGYEIVIAIRSLKKD